MRTHESITSFTKECNNQGYKKVLVLGCGSGREVEYLAQHGFELTGVDSSPATAATVEDLLQANSLPGKIYVDNLFDKVSSFSPAEFEAIMAINSLQFTDLKTFSFVITDLARVLIPSGLLLLVVDSQESNLDIHREQLAFSEDQLITQISKRFSVLDFYRDEDKNLVALLEKISH